MTDKKHDDDKEIHGPEDLVGSGAGVTPQNQPFPNPQDPEPVDTTAPPAEPMEGTHAFKKVDQWKRDGNTPPDEVPTGDDNKGE